MVLVRKTELACRNGWDDDLWEPRDGSSGTGGGTANGTANGRPSSASVTGRNGQRVVDPAERGHDIVVAPAEPAPTRNGTQIKAGAGIETKSASRNGERLDRLRVDDALNAWSSAFVTDLSRAPEQVDQFQGESVVPPERDRAADSQNQTDEPAHLDPGDKASVPETPTFGVDPTRSRLDEAGSAGLSVTGDRSAQSEDSPKVQQSGTTEQFEVDHEEVVAPQAEAELAEYSSQSDLAVSERSAGDVDDDRSAASPRLPMFGQTNACCRNCRDFLPSEGGSRGWCNNPFAFSKRQEVRGDTLACQSTVGNWWSPSDDWWMERADIAHHSAPTPLVDNLIRQIRSRELEERGSTEQRERS
jgi:hypothetical protein